MFKKRKNEVLLNDKLSVTDKLAGKIAGLGIQAQKQFAERMNKVFTNIDVKRFRIILIIFCICTGGYSLYLIVNSINSSDKKQKLFEVQQMDIPKHFNKTGDEELISEPWVDEETWIQIKLFRKYMDSLKQNSKIEYDSILQTRPGLMDSVQMLEQIYLSQKQN